MLENNLFLLNVIKVVKGKVEDIIISFNVQEVQIAINLRFRKEQSIPIRYISHIVIGNMIWFYVQHTGRFIIFSYLRENKE